METSNYYSDKNKRKFLNSAKPIQKVNTTENESEKIKETAKDVGSDLLVGVLGGGLLAAVLGRFAFVAGLGLSGYGHYCKNQKLSALGLGLMASGTMTVFNGKPIDPKLSSTEQITQRVKAFGDELKRKLFLDKLIPEKKIEAVNGIEKNDASASLTKIPKGGKPSETAFKEKEILERIIKSPEIKQNAPLNEDKLASNRLEEDDLFSSDRIY